MDSFLTKYLKFKGSNIADYLKNKISSLKTYHIISASLIFHACALMNLLNNNFPIFTFLFFTGYFCTILSKIYADKYEKLKNTDYLQNISQWMIVISLYSVFTNLYKEKINYPIALIVIILLILCNLNYLLSNYNDKSKCIELWSKCIKKINNKNNIIILQNVTKYFDDSFIIVYLITIMTYIYYKK